MEELDKSGRFSMRRVIRETGLSADTIRAWEDRYGIPEPKRSHPGHRLYSIYDIEVFKWMLKRRAEGVRPGQAARLFQDLVAAGEDPLAVAQYSTNTSGEWVHLEAMREEWFQACLRLDEAGVTRVMAQAFAQFPPAEVILGLFVAGMKDIGEGWLAGKVSVAQEHFGTQVATRKLEQCIAALPQGTRQECILIACPPGERHAFPALVAAYLLGQAGWQVMYFGADLPQDELDAIVRQSRLHFAILAGTSLATAPALANMVRRLQALGIPAGYGGFVYTHNPRLREVMPGHYLGDGLKQMADQMPAWLRLEPAVKADEPQSMVNFLSGLTVRRSELQQNLNLALSESSKVDERLSDLINTFLDNVKAAALLGDFELLDPEVEWTAEYIQANANIFSFTPKEFLLALGAVAREGLVEQARPFILWLSGQASHY